MIFKTRNHSFLNEKSPAFISVLLSLSLPIIYYATEYKIIPVISVLSIFFIFIASILIIYHTDKIEYIFTFGILFVSFYAFSSLPGNHYLEKYNYLLLAILFIAMLVIRSNQIFKYKEISKTQGFDKFLLYSFLLFFCISIIKNAQDLSKIDGIGKLITLVLSFYLFCYYIPITFLNDEKIFSLFLKILIYFGILTGLYGIITIFYVDLNSYNNYPGTAISFFKHPNATSSIYNFTIPPALYFLFFKKNEISLGEKNIFIAGIIIMIIGILMTFSRVGIISIGLIFLIMSFSYSKKIFWTTLLLIPVIGIYAISNFLTSKGTATIIGRAGLLATTIEMFKSSFSGILWGFGTISTIKVFHDIKVSLNVSDENNVPHNVFVYFILQFGIITAIPLFIYILKVIYKTIKRILSSYNNNPILILSTSICLSMMFKNLAEDLLFFPEFIMYNLFLIFFGFMIILANNKTLNKV